MVGFPFRRFLVDHPGQVAEAGSAEDQRTLHAVPGGGGAKGSSPGPAWESHAREARMLTSLHGESLQAPTTSAGDRFSFQSLIPRDPPTRSLAAREAPMGVPVRYSKAGVLSHTPKKERRAPRRRWLE